MRELIFVDTETSGFDDNPDARLVELTYARRTGDPKTLWFGVKEVPPVIDDLIGFTKRGLSGKRSNNFEIEAFLAVSKDATMVAANPAFDKHFIQLAGLWQFHYRTLDIEAYAMAKLRMDEVPGMKTIRDELVAGGVQITDPDHTSRNDVLALRESFLFLEQM